MEKPNLTPGGIDIAKHLGAREGKLEELRAAAEESKKEDPTNIDSGDLMAEKPESVAVSGESAQEAPAEEVAAEGENPAKPKDDSIEAERSGEVDTKTSVEDKESVAEDGKFAEVAVEEANSVMTEKTNEDPLGIKSKSRIDAMSAETTNQRTIRVEGGDEDRKEPRDKNKEEEQPKDKEKPKDKEEQKEGESSGGNDESRETPEAIEMGEAEVIENKEGENSAEIQEKELKVKEIELKLGELKRRLEAGVIPEKNIEKANRFVEVLEAELIKVQGELESINSRKDAEPEEIEGEIVKEGDLDWERATAGEEETILQTEFIVDEDPEVENKNEESIEKLDDKSEAGVETESAVNDYREGLKKSLDENFDKWKSSQVAFAKKGNQVGLFKRTLAKVGISFGQTAELVKEYNQLKTQFDTDKRAYNLSHTLWSNTFLEEQKSIILKKEKEKIMASEGDDSTAVTKKLLKFKKSQAFKDELFNFLTISEEGKVVKTEKEIDKEDGTKEKITEKVGLLEDLQARMIEVNQAKIEVLSEKDRNIFDKLIKSYSGLSKTQKLAVGTAIAGAVGFGGAMVGGAAVGAAAGAGAISGGVKIIRSLVGGAASSTVFAGLSKYFESTRGNRKEKLQKKEIKESVQERRVNMFSMMEKQMKMQKNDGYKAMAAAGVTGLAVGSLSRSILDIPSFEQAMPEIGQQQGVVESGVQESRTDFELENQNPVLEEDGGAAEGVIDGGGSIPEKEALKENSGARETGSARVPEEEVTEEIKADNKEFFSKKAKFERQEYQDTEAYHKFEKRYGPQAHAQYIEDHGDGAEERWGRNVKRAEKIYMNAAEVEVKMNLAAVIAEKMGIDFDKDAAEVTFEAHIPTVINGEKVPLELLSEEQRNAIVAIRKLAAPIEGAGETSGEGASPETSSAPEEVASAPEIRDIKEVLSGIGLNEDSAVWKGVRALTKVDMDKFAELPHGKGEIMNAIRSNGASVFNELPESIKQQYGGFINHREALKLMGEMSRIEGAISELAKEGGLPEDVSVEKLLSGDFQRKVEVPESVSVEAEGDMSSSGETVEVPNEEVQRGAREERTSPVESAKEMDGQEEVLPEREFSSAESELIAQNKVFFRSKATFEVMGLQDTEAAKAFEEKFGPQAHAEFINEFGENSEGIWRDDIKKGLTESIDAAKEEVKTDVEGGSVDETGSSEKEPVVAELSIDENGQVVSTEEGPKILNTNLAQGEVVWDKVQNHLDGDKGTTAKVITKFKDETITQLARDSKLTPNEATAYVDWKMRNLQIGQTVNLENDNLKIDGFVNDKSLGSFRQTPEFANANAASLGGEVVSESIDGGKGSFFDESDENISTVEEFAITPDNYLDNITNEERELLASLDGEKLFNNLRDANDKLYESTNQPDTFNSYHALGTGLISRMKETSDFKEDNLSGSIVGYLSKGGTMKKEELADLIKMTRDAENAEQLYA